MNVGHKENKSTDDIKVLIFFYFNKTISATHTK